MGGKAPFFNELLASYFVITCMCIPIHFIIISISTFKYITHKPLYIIGYVLFIILIMVLLYLAYYYASVHDVLNDNDWSKNKDDEANAFLLYASVYCCTFIWNSVHQLIIIFRQRKLRKEIQQPLAVD